MSLHRNKRIIKKQQIEIALEMMTGSMIIAYGYMHNKNYILTEQDLKMLDIFAEELHRNYYIVNWIAHYLHKHNHGETKYIEKIH